MKRNVFLVVLLSSSILGTLAYEMDNSLNSVRSELIGLLEESDRLLDDSPCKDRDAAVIELRKTYNEPKIATQHAVGQACGTCLKTMKPGADCGVTTDTFEEVATFFNPNALEKSEAEVAQEYVFQDDHHKHEDKVACKGKENIVAGLQMPTAGDGLGDVVTEGERLRGLGMDCASCLDRNPSTTEAVCGLSAASSDLTTLTQACKDCCDSNEEIENTGKGDYKLCVLEDSCMEACFNEAEMLDSLEEHLVTNPDQKVTVGGVEDKGGEDDPVHTIN